MQSRKAIMIIVLSLRKVFIILPRFDLPGSISFPSYISLNVCTTHSLSLGLSLSLFSPVIHRNFREIRHGLRVLPFLPFSSIFPDRGYTLASAIVVSKTILSFLLSFSFVVIYCKFCEFCHRFWIFLRVYTRKCNGNIRNDFNSLPTLFFFF